MYPDNLDVDVKACENGLHILGLLPGVAIELGAPMLVVNRCGHGEIVSEAVSVGHSQETAKHVLIARQRRLTAKATTK